MAKSSGSVGVSVSLVLSMMLHLPSMASTQPFSSPLKVVYPPTEDRGAPERTRGSGSRGCGDYVASPDQGELAALMPKNNISTTVDAQPSLYFYVPVTKQSPAELTLYDWTNQNRTPIYQTKLSLKPTAGIVKLTLPKTIQLQPDIIYAWNFSIYCSTNPQEAYQYVDGWLQRVELSPQQQTQLEQLQQQPLAQAQFYAQAGIWANALDLLLQNRLSFPQLWQGFLESVDLPHLAQYSVVDYSQLTIANQDQDFVGN